MKLILQHDDRDCGAACLAMIAWHHGYKMPLSFFRQLTKTDRNGTNLYGIVDAASKIELQSQVLNGDFTELLNEIRNGNITFPFVAHIVNEQGLLHFVVVTGIKRRCFQVLDPGIGKRKIDFQTFSQCWSGYLAIFEKANTFQKYNGYKNSLVDFLGMLRGNYLKLFSVLLISIIITMIGIYSSLVFELVIDNFYSNQGDTHIEILDEEEGHEEHSQTDETHVHSDETEQEDGYWLDTLKIMEYFNKLYQWFLNFVTTNSFNFVFVLLLIFYGIQAIMQFIRGRMICMVARNIDLGIMMQYVKHLLGLPISSINTRMTGEYLSRFSDIYIIRDAISSASLTVLLDTVMMFACGLMLYFQNAKLFGITLIMLVLYALIVVLFRKPVERTNRKAMEYSAITESYFKETIDGMETIKAADAEKTIQKRMETKMDKLVKAVFQSDMVSVSQNTLTMTIELVGTALILWMGFSMVLKNHVTIGQMMTFYSLLSMFTGPVKNLIELQPTVQTAIVAAERLNDVLDMEIEEQKGILKIDSTIREYTIENVDFRYGNQEKILSDININIQQGEKIALIGESGSGKTTIAKLLMKFYKPEKGTIKLNGHCISEYCLEDIRKNIAYVDQNIFLFSDTIRNNLKLGCEDVSDEEMIRICQMCHAHEFIEKLPMGYDTPLAENGANLSGGQRQRLAIARALLKKPQLLILDEATSHLDIVTEEGIRNMIFQFDSSLTCVIIAHRLSNTKACDCIYVLKDGKIIEKGKHEDLLKQKGTYASLWNRQCYASN